MAKGLSMKVLLSLQAKEFQRGLKGIQRQLNTFKSYLSTAFALGSITAFGRKMVEVGKDFESAMARVQAVSNASTEEFQRMTAEARRMGETTRYTATEAAEALEKLTRNGMSAANATKALSGVMQLAQANSIGLAEAADIITNTLNMFGLTVDQTSRVNDVLSSTVSNAATNITELYEALVNASPAAKVLGFSIEETSAALGALAQRGLKGADAGTQLRMAFTKMADPDIIKKLKAYGVAIDENTMKQEGLIATVQKLRNANLSLSDLVDIFSQRGAVGMQQLINSYTDFSEILEITQNSAGTTARMFNQSIGSVQKELDILRSKYESLLIDISNRTGGVIKGVIRLLQNLIDNFKTVGGSIMNIASVAIPLLGNKIIQLGRNMKSFFNMVKTEGAMTSAMIGGWITAIATLVTWVGTALVGAWQRSHQAIKDANKQMASVAVESEKTRTAVRKLQEEIGDGSNESSVNGAVARAIELFPQFATALREAHRIAAQTGNYEKLKNVLNDIADLQEAIATRDAQEAILNANAEVIGRKMWDSTTTFGKNNSPLATADEKLMTNVSTEIRKGLEDAGLSKDAIKNIFTEIAKIITRNGSEDKKADSVQAILKRYNVEIDKTRLMMYQLAVTGTNQKDDALRKAVENAKSSQTGMHRADSTANANAFKVFEEAFKNAEEYNNQLLRENKISQKDFKDTMHKAAEDFADSVSSINPTKAQNAIVQEALKKYPAVPITTVGGGSDKTTGKTDTDKVKELFEKFDEETVALKNQLDRGAITEEEYKNAIDKLEDSTYKSITAFADLDTILSTLSKNEVFSKLKAAFDENQENAKSLKNTQEALEQIAEIEKMVLPKKGKRDSSNDYMYGGSDSVKPEVNEKLKQQLENIILKEEASLSKTYADSIQQMLDDLKQGIENGDFDLVKENAIKKMNDLAEALKQARSEAESLQAKANLSDVIINLDSQIKDFSDNAFNNISSVASAFDRLMDGIKSIAEAFGEELEWEGLEKVMSVVNGTIQLMEAMRTIIQVVQTVQDIATKKKALNAAKEVAANAAVTASETTKAAAEGAAAAAGGASAVAGIPIVGPVLAVAAVGAIVAAILAGMQKFATGGIVGGSSTSGDNNIVRANSGELILNKAQQGSLYKAIASGNLGGNGGEWRVRGTDLIKVINNTQNKLRG